MPARPNRRCIVFPPAVEEAMLDYLHQQQPWGGRVSVSAFVAEAVAKYLAELSQQPTALAEG